MPLNYNLLFYVEFFCFSILTTQKYDEFFSNYVYRIQRLFAIFALSDGHANVVWQASGQRNTIYQLNGIYYYSSVCISCVHFREILRLYLVFMWSEILLSGRRICKHTP